MAMINEPRFDYLSIHRARSLCPDYLLLNWCLYRRAARRDTSAYRFSPSSRMTHRRRKER